MAEAIRTNSTGGGAKGDSRSGNSASSPAVIAIMGILGTAFLLVTYYAMVAKFCGRGPARASMRRSWRAAGRRRLNEEALGLQEEAAQEQGLEQADIEAIPVVAFLKRGRSKKVSCSGGGGGPLDCAVCLNEFEEAERVRLLPSCCHAFHLQCIDEWLRSHATCPLCRTPIRLAAAAILGFPNPSSGIPISAATTPPATSPPAAPPQQTPIPAGGENESLQTDATDWPLLADQCRKGACSTRRTRMRSQKQLTQSSTYDDDDEGEGDTESSHLGRRQRPQFAFTRCFSYTAGGGRSSPQNLMSAAGGAAASPACLQYPIDVGAVHHASIATTLSSPSSTYYTSTPKHGRTAQRILKMQRSRSYSVGSSLFSIISTRQLPAPLHDQRSRTPSTATASSKLWGSSTKVSAGAAAARVTVDHTHSQQHLQNFNERDPLQQHLRQENGYFLKRSTNVMNSLTAAGNCSSDGFGDNTPVTSSYIHDIDIEHNAMRNSSPDAVDDIPHDINLHGHPMEDRQSPPSRPPPPFTFQC